MKMITGKLFTAGVMFALLSCGAVFADEVTENTSVAESVAAPAANVVPVSPDSHCTGPGKVMPRRPEPKSGPAHTGPGKVMPRRPEPKSGPAHTGPGKVTPRRPEPKSGSAHTGSGKVMPRRFAPKYGSNRHGLSHFGPRTGSRSTTIGGPNIAPSAVK